VNNDENFRVYALAVIEKLRESGLTIDDSGLTMTDTFLSAYIKHPKYNQEVKVDFVNDIAAHYGGFTRSSLYPKTDSVRNILSNKISAIFRYEGKDVADIVEIARHEQFDWFEIITETRNKVIGVEANVVGEILLNTPKRAFDDVNWVEPAPSWDKFQEDLKVISKDIESLTSNSLSATTSAG
jgi:hypothetical protein